MERTNYVARAKKLLAQSARTTALVIVPLAAAATAQATTTFSNTAPTTVVLPVTGSPSCSGQGDGASNCDSNVGDSQLPNVSGFEGVSFFTLTSENVTIPVSGGSVATLTMSDGGTFGQTLPASIPLTWNFTLAANGGSTISGWNLKFELGTSAGNSADGSFTTTGGAGAGTFTGSGTMTASGSPATLYETIVLAISTSGASGNVVITAPFDFGVPEPATVGTLGAGLGFLAWLFRRRKRA